MAYTGTRKKHLEPNTVLGKVLLHAGNQLLLKGKREEALKSYTKVLSLMPNDKHALAARSKLYCELGKFDKALVDANASLMCDELFLEGLYQKAQALYFLGKFEKALMYYQKLYRLNPHSDRYRLGIVRAEEAITSSIPEKLENKGDLTFLQEDVKTLLAKIHEESKLQRRETDLLEELYSQCLENFPAEPETVPKDLSKVKRKDKGEQPKPTKQHIKIQYSYRSLSMLKLRPSQKDTSKGEGEDKDANKDKVDESRLTEPHLDYNKQRLEDLLSGEAKEQKSKPQETHEDNSVLNVLTSLEDLSKVKGKGEDDEGDGEGGGESEGEAEGEGNQKEKDEDERKEKEEDEYHKKKAHEAEAIHNCLERNKLQLELACKVKGREKGEYKHDDQSKPVRKSTEQSLEQIKFEPEPFSDDEDEGKDEGEAEKKDAVKGEGNLKDRVTILDSYTEHWYEDDQRSSDQSRLTSVDVSIGTKYHSQEIRPTLQRTATDLTPSKRETRLDSIKASLRARHRCLRHLTVKECPRFLLHHPSELANLVAGKSKSKKHSKRKKVQKSHKHSRKVNRALPTCTEEAPS